MTVRFIFDADGLLIGADDGYTILENSTPLPPLPAREDGAVQRFKNGAWVFDGQSPQVLAPKFLLLFTLAERAAIRAVRDSNPGAGDLLQMLEDPRLDYVELNDPGLIEVITFLSTGEEPLLTPDRVSRILSGKAPVVDEQP
ncbi:hypothetical protein KDX38_08400 [Pseudomonas sp. CDFA 602]|uniref:hypothetical protein n=1 Tax=Pseudomonas californiensis TaxID=2829823 RepID=UPI001E3FFCED|nr:hypothetical protein [Pseudomonas californiensis]MCD5993640.1 hypothetical protein [Pseudomonas californiensis]MCD5999235.1 hypothetical protein [Pseudomonas californiensis]